MRENLLENLLMENPNGNASLFVDSAGLNFIAAFLPLIFVIRSPDRMFVNTSMCARILEAVVFSHIVVSMSGTEYLPCAQNNRNAPPSSGPGSLLPW